MADAELGEAMKRLEELATLVEEAEGRYERRPTASDNDAKAIRVVLKALRACHESADHDSYERAEASYDEP